MVANPLWGMWIDRRGLWVTILAAVALWSLASGSHAFIFGLGGMCLARGVLGFGEGATFPAGLATVAETLPLEQRSFGLGLAYSGGSLGAALTPLLITPIALRFGWRSTFGITAGLGLLWILLWIWLRSSGVYRSGASVGAQASSVPIAAGAKWNRNLIATAAIYGLGAAPLAFGLYAAPLYLSRVLHVSQASLGHLLWVPPAGWEAGYLFWGKVADRRVARSAGGPGGLFAGLCVCGFLIVLAPAAARCAWPILATMLLFFAQMFVAGGFVVLSLSDGMQAQPKANSGFLAGVAISSWALATGLLTPVLGHFFDLRAYAEGFWLVASLPVVGVLCWRILRQEASPLVQR
jgi:MFS family permease